MCGAAKPLNRSSTSLRRTKNFFGKFRKFFRFSFRASPPHNTRDYRIGLCRDGLRQEGGEDGPGGRCNGTAIRRRPARGGVPRRERREAACRSAAPPFSRHGRTFEGQGHPFKENVLKVGLGGGQGIAEHPDVKKTLQDMKQNEVPAS